VWGALALVLAGALALRLWGLRQGLPYAYNADEADHFVPRAIDMFGRNLNPHYFANPPALTYLLHVVFAVAYAGAAGARRAFSLHPAEVYELARVVVAVIGAGGVWLLYLLGARLFGRGVGLLAAAIEAVAFLAVFYSHLALNDVPALTAVTLSLLGSAGVLTRGRVRDYALAGAGLGLACATKYTAGIAILPLLAAAAVRVRAERDGAHTRALAACALAGVLALAAFIAANPYALIDYSDFQRELAHQSALSAEAQGKLGAPHDGGIPYYLWSLTWGLGWVPALAALAGALSIWRRRAGAQSAASGVSLGLMLVPAPLVFLLVMGVQGRYFGRWLLPVIPILCLLAAAFVFDGAAMLSARPGVRRAALAAAAVALLVQGAVYSVHCGLVLSRADTRNIARAWMVRNIPPGAAIVAEPVSPDEWAREVRAGTSTARNPYRWKKYPALRSRTDARGVLLGGAGSVVGVENYERTLSPALLGYYTAHGYCWVISASTQSGRSRADPAAVPHAVAYYAALARQGEARLRVSPYSGRRDAPPFNFDWSFDYYPLAYERPGPELVVYRLHGAKCLR
jgi:4-amino-4-deoxy-L-arabinose transferase-like glycosyltransferase